jgi:beta-glucosidase
MANGDTGDVACDHYHRWKEDVALMRELGLNAYRFSISWSRILPEGTGRINQKGLDFYRRLVEALREAGIAPNATLYHWDLPAALDDRGGWLNRDSAAWFGDYAEICFKALGDQVEMWATLNEPWVIAEGGYLQGTLAPGHSNLFEAPRVAHHLLLAHATAVEAFRAQGPGKIGIVVNIEPKHSASDSPEDQAATARADAAMNRHYLDPLFFGRYPEELSEVYGRAWPHFPEADLDRIPIPFDWLGLNYYTRAVVQADPQAWPTGAIKVHQPRSTYTETHWEVYPQGLTDTLQWLAQRYGPIPLYVTENGAAFYDPPTAEGGKVEDPLRVEYLRQHLRAVGRAIDAGVDVRGYFAWSLFDNLEWSLGYAKRFGIVHVDFATLERTVKASGRFYAGVVRAGWAGL